MSDLVGLVNVQLSVQQNVNNEAIILELLENILVTLP